MSQAPTAKRKFDLAGFRHQLLTPLNHIIGHAELLLDELPEAGYSALYQDLKRIRETARGLVRRVHAGLVPNPGKSWAKVLADLRYEMAAPVHTILQAVGAITSEYRNDLNVTDVMQIGRAAAELLAIAEGPVATSQEVPPAPARTAMPPVAPRTGKILIVDDNFESSRLLGRQLKRQGYEVTEAASGAEALALLLQSEQDLVLLDVLMPKLDGFQVLERIKADPALAGIPVIVLSALDEIPGVVRSIEIGAEDYLFKPFDSVLLGARICSALEKKRLRDLERRQAIGERQRALEIEETNRQLRLSEQRLHLALQADHAIIWDWDLGDQITRWGAGGAAHSPETIESMLEMVHAEDRERIRRRLLAAVASRTNFQEECRVMDPAGGIRWFAAMGALDYDADGKPVCMTGVARDISQQRQAEMALRKSNQDFQRFAMAASHDLREPLRSVEADLQSLLEPEAAVPEAAQQRIGAAIGQLSRMSKLVRDLLDYSDVSLKRDRRRPASAEAVLALVLSDLKIAIEESGAQITHDPLPVVFGDFMMLHRLFQNLIANSIKYRSAEAPRIHLSAERQNGCWKFTVADNGAGIAPRFQESIFGVFHRLHGGDVPGSGLGLAICRRILERLDGKIWVESEAGKGSKFFFTLPAS